ncbi:transcriptional regulator [Polycladomyces abyssicola]|jgi:DNA-binding HxlR family transcriptional regulator|uniref:Transcriptional regulator n=2 Tax=Polycladomyces abyssicola TaxID=1125966 RepID=A0A8D5UF85_9BACL|nr:transcriptional regulator [Polycladomyces abyssicola]
MEQTKSAPHKQEVCTDRDVEWMQCSVEEVLDVIGAKWSFLILRDLIEGPKRFGELLQSLKGASPKTLSVRLKELERHGIVTRTVYPEIPPKVEYALTEKGLDLKPIFREMKKWGCKWLK